MSIFDSFFKKITGKQASAQKPVPTSVTAPVIPPPPPPVAPVKAPGLTDPQMPKNMKTSPIGIELIKSFEGVELRAYPDPGTGGDPWTIGYGHTGPEVKRGVKITQEEAEAILKKDLERFEAGIWKLVKVPITQAMFDALVSFSFNVGTGDTAKMKGGLAGSTLLRLLNEGDYSGAASNFIKWNKAGGKEMLGLTRRRRAETEVFQKGIYDLDALKKLVNDIMMSK